MTLRSEIHSLIDDVGQPAHSLEHDAIEFAKGSDLQMPMLDPERG